MRISDWSSDVCSSDLDRVVVMSQGRIEQVGTPDEVYDQPNSTFVYSFIGESSALPISVRGGQLQIADRPIGIEATAFCEGGFFEGEATLHFRPHDVELVNGPGPAIAGVVTAVRRHEGVRRVELEVGAGRHRIEIEVPLDRPLNTSGRLSLRPTRWRLFPTGEADRKSVV